MMIDALASKTNYKNNNIIAIASGKGGVGKTWFSISLCHALVLAQKNVLLFDADIGLANVDVQLGIISELNLSAVIKGQITLAQACSAHPGTGINIIAGRSGSGNLSNITLSKLRNLTEELTCIASNYDNVIMDLGAGLDKAVRNILQIAGTTIIITSDEPTALTDAYACIKIMRVDNPQCKIQLIINSANTLREGERTYNTMRKACEGFLKFSPPLLGIVRRDTNVKESIKNQSSIFEHAPSSQAASDVMAIAERLLDNF